jgi:AAA15 family ATPase/GTPase
MKSASLDLEAGSIREFPKNVFQTGLGTLDTKLLRNVNLFGGNSSGKSNFFKAFSTMRYLVLNSFNEGGTAGLPVFPFLLNQTTENKPTKFDIAFLIGNINYKYGFSYDKDRIVTEYLSSIVKRKEENIFVRHELDFNFEKQLGQQNKQEIKLLQKLIRPQTLFLSILARFDIDFAMDIMSWFVKSKLFNDDHIERNVDFTASLIRNTDYRELIMNILGQSDLGFSSIKEELSEKIEKQRRNESLLNALYEEELGNFKVKTKHTKFNSNFELISTLYFDLMENESAGAQKFFSMLGPIAKALVDGSLIWIDEVDSRLHALLVQLVISIVNSPKYNKKGCQAIFSTHNTSVIKKIRRDQMIMVSKDEFGVSSLASVYVGSPKVRSDAIIEKEYLNNQLGGVPNIQSQLDIFDSE